MTLRHKILVMACASLVLTLALYSALCGSLLSQISRLEREEAKSDAARARDALGEQISTLARVTEDYGKWDDSYRFVEDRNQAYVESNLVVQTFVNLDLDVMVFCDRSGRVVFARAADPEEGEEKPLPEGLVAGLKPGSALLGQGSLQDSTSGILLLAGGPMLVASSPILRSDETGPSRGALIMGRWLDASAVARLASLTHLSLSLHRLEEAHLPAEVREALRSGRGAEGAVLGTVTRETITSYLPMADIEGEPTLVLQAEVQRGVHQRLHASLSRLLMGLLIVGGTCALIGFLLVDRLMLSRLAGLNAGVAEVGASGDLSARVAARGRDEIGGLARAINGMLGALERSQRELRESEERYRAFVEQSSDGVWRLELEEPLAIETPIEGQIEHILGRGYVAECNDILAQMHGRRRAEELLGARFGALCGGGEEQNRERVRLFVRGGYRLTDVMVEGSDGNGGRRHYRCSLVGIVEKGALVRAWGSQTDITARRRAEMLLRLQTSAINAASDQVLILDREGNIEFANPAFEQATRYALGELAGQSAELLLPQEGASERPGGPREAIENGVEWEGEVSTRRKDGSTFTAEAAITPVRNEEGEIEHFVAIGRDVTERRRWQEQLDRLAYHDGLTGLPNRVLLGERLKRAIAEASRRGEMLAVMFLDLDRFKLINDTLGHSMGDLLLKLVAERLTRSVRETDTIARTGGDEFTVIASGLSRSEEAGRLAQRLLDAFKRPFVLESQEFFVSASIGVSLYPQDGTDGESLVKNADTAMYRAKEQGRNNCQFFTRELSRAASERMKLEKNLRKALEREEFVVFYQPRVDSTLERVLGAEALLRWRQPELGMVYPDQFIHLAEEMGQLGPISEWVLRRACAQSKAWQEAGLGRVSVEVNISAGQLHQQDLVEIVGRALDETGLDPRYLGLELTESALMRNPERAVQVLGVLKDMGLHIYIDDFGTGDSSLRYLTRFPVDAVKIDRSFVRNIAAEDDAAIVSAIVGLAHSLKLKAIAEGVETAEQLEFLRGLGCDEVQGYLVRPPIPAEDFAEELRARVVGRAAG